MILHVKTTSFFPEKTCWFLLSSEPQHFLQVFSIPESMLWIQYRFCKHTLQKLDFVYPMQKFRKRQKIPSLKKYSIMLDFKSLNFLWNIENLAPPLKNVVPSKKSRFFRKKCVKHIFSARIIFLNVWAIEISLEISVEIEISIELEIKSKFFKIDGSRGFSKIHLHCRSNFEKPLFGGVQKFWKTWIWISSLIEISISTEISNEA